jgi:hypothetical protein
LKRSATARKAQAASKIKRRTKKKEEQWVVAPPGEKI